MALCGRPVAPGRVGGSDHGPGQDRQARLRHRIARTVARDHQSGAWVQRQGAGVGGQTRQQRDRRPVRVRLQRDARDQGGAAVRVQRAQAGVARLVDQAAGQRAGAVVGGKEGVGRHKCQFLPARGLWQAAVKDLQNARVQSQ